MPAVTVKLPAELDAVVTRLARAQGTTRSAVVRHAIEAYWAREVGASGVGSFLDVNRDLVGIGSGPEDLSTSPEHLEGFGR